MGGQNFWSLELEVGAVIFLFFKKSVSVIHAISLLNKNQRISIDVFLERFGTYAQLPKLGDFLVSFLWKKFI